MRALVVSVAAFLIALSKAAVAEDGPLPNPYSDADAAAAAMLLNQDFQAVNSCYRGANQWFKDDLLSRAIDELLKKLPEPGGLCDRYLRHASDVPLEVHVGVPGGISLSYPLSTEKLCDLVKHPRCPE